MFAALMSCSEIDVSCIVEADDDSAVSAFPGSRFTGFSFQTENGSMSHPGS